MPRICHGSNLLMDRKESDYCLNPSPKGIEGGGGAAVKWLINEIGGPRQREGGTAGEGGPLSGFVRSFSSASSSWGKFGGYGQGFSDMFHVPPKS